MLNRYFFAPLAALLLVATTQLAHAQTGAVGIGTTAPDASAALDIVSSSKGVLLPRVASAAAIASPAAGLLVYQTGGTPGFYYNSGTAANADWLRLSPADNLGNHIATQNLNLGTNLLTGTGGYTGSAVGIGVRADGGLDLGQNTAGNNLYVGFRAGSANTTQPGGYGTGNQYIGYQSGLRNTTGNRNDFSGFQSGYSNTTGSQNTFGGYLSGSSNTEGHSNTFYGFYSGGGTTTGIGNTFVGSQTGISNRTGTNNTALGINSGPVSGGFGTGPVLSNATAVGANVGLTASNTLILGNEANVGIGTSDPAQKLEVRNGNVLLQSSSSAYVGIRSYSGIVGTVDLGVAATARSFSPLDQAGDAVLISNRSLVLAGRQGGSVVVGTGANIEQERLRVTSDGNVGIGTSTPAQRLEVAGSVQISGTGNGLLFPDGTTQTTAANAASTQALALSGQDLSLSPGGNTVTLPTQQLSISGSTLSLSNGGSVTLPTTPGDNLGNHLATNNIGLNNNWLSNAPGNANGLRIDNLGNVGIGGLPAATGLHIRTAEKNSVSSLPGVFLSGGASGNPNIELRGTNGSAYLDFVNNFTADYDSRILAGNTGLGFYTGGTGTGGGLRMLLASGGAVTLSNLAGSSTRMVTADASGTLAAQPLPTDAQQLSISSTSSGSTISLTNGGSVTVPGTTDNLGNHTATQNLNLGTNALVGNGGSTGLTIASSGAIATAGALTTGGAIAAGGNVQLGANLLTGNGGSAGLAVSSTGSVGIGGSAPASAALAVTSTTQGFLPPRLTTAARDAIGAPAPGLTIYNTTTAKLNTWNGTTWSEGLTTTEQAPLGSPTTFSYSGREQTYVVPANVYSVSIAATGASGNSPIGNTVPAGGVGGQVQGTLAVVPGQALTVRVGGQGVLSFSSSGQPGGYNGGGSVANQGSSGGGASDVRTGGTAYTNRVLVAGGGGGAGYAVNSAGGAGGSATGAGTDGVSNTGGTGATGATQAGPGSINPYTDGTGGPSTSATNSSGGGGGGYYGGGGNGNSSGGGGGGSSWASANVTAVSYGVATAPGNGSVTITPGPAYAAPVLSGANFVNVPGTWSVSGADVYRSSGNVGIGTASPTQKLDVAGNVNVMGNSVVGGTLTAGAASFAGNATVSGSTTIGGTAYVNGSLGVALNGQDRPLITRGYDAFASGSYQGTGRWGLFMEPSRLTFGIPAVADRHFQWVRYKDNSTIDATLMFLSQSGTLGVGIASPLAGLHITTGNGGPGTGAGTAGALLSGAPNVPPYLELRGTGAGTNTTTPYIDFAETNDQDYTTRLISQGGILNVSGAGNTGQLLQVNGGLRATSYANISDARFKTNVRPLVSALASVLALRGVRYEWNALGIKHGGQAGAPQVGVLAQEVEKIYPELVSTGPDGYKAVNYAQLTPVLIEALKEQQAEIEALKATAAAAKAEAGAANTRAASAEAKATQATATLETFEARLRRLESGAGGQAQR